MKELSVISEQLNVEKDKTEMLVAKLVMKMTWVEDL